MFRVQMQLQTCIHILRIYVYTQATSGIRGIRGDIAVAACNSRIPSGSAKAAASHSEGPLPQRIDS